jgi:uncharacterized membrane protein
MKKLSGLLSLSGLVILFPALVSAVTLFDTLVTINRFLNAMIGVIITIAIIVFFWGLVTYLREAGEAKHNGLIMIFYSLIALFVMVSIWGIIHVIQATFQVSGQNQAIIPQGIGIAP